MASTQLIVGRKARDVKSFAVAEELNRHKRERSVAEVLKVVNQVLTGAELDVTCLAFMVGNDAR